MEIKNLKILSLMVADPHLSRTAERLHMTQSALSKRLQSIEAELGFPLFERRGPRGLRPLGRALELAHTADKILSAWEVGVKRVQREASEPEHFVLVGPQLFLREVVLPWWTQASKDFPELQLEVQVSPITRISLDTVQTSADAAILEHKDELADFVCKPIYTERWGIVRHIQSEFSDLSKYTWGTHSPIRNPVDVWLVQKQKMPPPKYRFYWQDLTAVALWIAETPGAASVLPWHVVAWLSKRKRVVFDPLGPEATSRLYLAYPKNSPHRRLLKSMSQMAQGPT